MRSREVTLGRSFAVAFDHGEDFFTALASFCHDHNVRPGIHPRVHRRLPRCADRRYLRETRQPERPRLAAVHLTNVEALGAGTLAYDQAHDRVAPHIHVSVGVKEHSATGHISHLLAATVQFLTEMLIIEVTAPDMQRIPQPDLYDVPLLQFGSDTTRF